MSRRSFVALLLFVMIGAGAAIYFAPQAHPSVSATSPKATSVSMPLFFEANQGQTDPQVKFLARGSGYGIFLTANEAVLKLQPSALSTQQSASSVIRMRLDGAAASTGVAGIEQLPGKSNYFIGNDPSRWQRGIPQFARVEYNSIYPGINLVYYGNEGHLEYDFRVAPAGDPEQIALTFGGATARLQDGDLVLSTEHGDVRFHAPRVYQHANSGEREIGGRFRQLAENKIGFAVDAYDRSRELIIDPVLSYSTFLGGSLDESSVHVAIGQDNNIYLAGSTMSSNFPVTTSTTLSGTQNIFIAVINPSLPSGQQLLYATFLGGDGKDTAAGVGVTPHIDQNTTGYDVYVAGTTTSTNFPTNGVLTPFQTCSIQSPCTTNTHGFVSRLNIGDNQLSYSTYLAGNGADFVTGLAVDLRGDAFVTGNTSSTDSATGFPSTLNAFQQCPFEQGVQTCPTFNPGVTPPPQFFASKINTAGTGAQSMLYSTFFGGGYLGTTAIGGGIAVDVSGNMYFTGGTNTPSGRGPNPTDFPFFITSNAQQACLNVPASAGATTCPTPTTALDGFVVKINPNVNVAGQPPILSTYLGGTADDVATAVAVDGSSNIYVTGQTTSGDWLAPTAITPFQQCLNNTAAAPPCGGSTASDAFLIKLANPASATAVFPPVYFTYLGGSGDDFGHGIVVDATQNAHLVGTTSSADLPVKNNLQGFGGSSDAFVALISTTIASTSTASGNYLTYLGGSGTEEGTGIALDINNAAYVSGSTNSANFPVASALQPSLGGSQDAFVSRLGASSMLSLAAATNSPSPNPPVAGTPVAFTFDIANTGPDPATNVIFTANLPTSGVASQTAKVTSGSGSCGSVVSNTITCTISSLAVQSSSTTGFGVVEVDVTPTVPVLNPVISVFGSVFANGNPVNPVTLSQSTQAITDFSVSATPAQQTVTAGQNTSFTVTLKPAPSYTATVSMTDSGLPTASTGTFTSSSVAMSGSTQATTTLNISTTARPVTTGSMFRGRALYATWLPIGGLSLLGLGVGAGKKRRTWIGIALLGLLAGLLLLQPGCGSSSPTTTTGGTPAGTYTITITGTSGSVSHNTTVRLVVN